MCSELCAGRKFAQTDSSSLHSVSICKGARGRLRGERIFPYIYSCVYKVLIIDKKVPPCPIRSSLCHLHSVSAAFTQHIPGERALFAHFSPLIAHSGWLIFAFPRLTPSSRFRLSAHSFMTIATIRLDSLDGAQ